MFSFGALNGYLQNIEYELYNERGEKYKCRGAYIIVDGGYVNSPVFIDPDKFRWTRDAVLWSEWLESVRKDVENFFGMLKPRWRFFRNGICYHDREFIAKAFKVGCCLHNMILIHDEVTGIRTTTWETVDWEQLDPEADESVDVDDEDINDDREVDIVAECTQQPILERENALSQDEHVTVFGINDSKRVLKAALMKSFSIQWILGRLKWPARFDSKKKAAMPLDRATMELHRALYTLDSNLRRLDTDTNLYTIPIRGKGLFSKIMYKKDEPIISFIGTVRTQAKYMEICETEPWRKAYSIAFSTNGDVLDCYDHYVKGLCIASYANSPKKCHDVITGKAAMENCYISVNYVEKTITLKCGYKKRHCPDSFVIPAGTELLWDYGDSFVNYNDFK